MIEQSFSINRQNFLDIARATGARLSTIPHARDPSLTTDIAVLGAEEASQIVLVVSGVHGVELPAGSVLQHLWMPHVQNLLRQKPDIKFVFVHALNPYGAEHGMRTDWDAAGEGNIDPARNFVDFKVATNEANAGIENALKNADLSCLAATKMWVKLLYSAFIVQGKAVFKQGFVRGQYTNPDIPYYGGKAPSLTRLTWDKILADFVLAPHVKKIWHLDCHTGDGPHGLLQLYINNREDAHIYGDAASLIAPERVKATDHHFAAISGDIIDYWGYCHLHEAKVTPITLEFGTSKAAIEGIDVLNAILTRTILQNRYQDKHPKAAKIIQLMRDAFAPRCPEWERAVSIQATEFWEKLKVLI
jgi:hypothetical protein